MQGRKKESTASELWDWLNKQKKPHAFVIPCPLVSGCCFHCNLNHVNDNVHTPGTTYKTRFDSGSILNECELWKKEEKEDRNEIKRGQRDFYFVIEKNSKTS